MPQVEQNWCWTMGLSVASEDLADVHLNFVAHLAALTAAGICLRHAFRSPHHVPAIAPASVGRELVRRKNIVKLSVSPSVGVRKSHEKLLRLAEMRVCKETFILRRERHQIASAA